jgi:hypothetical protein
MATWSCVQVSATITMDGMGQLFDKPILVLQAKNRELRSIRDSPYFDGLHGQMLANEQRMSPFHEAIAKRVPIDSHVVDYSVKTRLPTLVRGGIRAFSRDGSTGYAARGSAAGSSLNSLS